jgi:hypothetical protein
LVFLMKYCIRNWMISCVEDGSIFVWKTCSAWHKKWRTQTFEREYEWVSEGVWVWVCECECECEWVSEWVSVWVSEWVSEWV